MLSCFYGWVWLKVSSWWYLGTFCLETHLGDIHNIIIGNIASPTRHFRQFSMKKMARGSIFDTFRALSRRGEGILSWYFGVILPNPNHELPYRKVARIAICPLNRMSGMPKNGTISGFQSHVLRDFEFFGPIFIKNNQGSKDWGNPTDHFWSSMFGANSSGWGATSQKEG